MEKVSTRVDIYLGKLFAGEAVNIEDVFRLDSDKDEIAPFEKIPYLPPLDGVQHESLFHS